MSFSLKCNETHVPEQLGPFSMPTPFVCPSGLDVSNCRMQGQRKALAYCTNSVPFKKRERVDVEQDVGANLFQLNVCAHNGATDHGR